jgi:hypothetical protein
MIVILMILIGFPILSVFLGGVGYFFFKNIYISSLIIFTVSAVSTYTLIYDSFWIWVLIYTLLSLGGGICGKILYIGRYKSPV